MTGGRGVALTVTLTALLGTVGGAVWVITWIAGCVLAKGLGSTFLCVTTGGLWSAYLVVEKIMRAMGWA